MPVLCPDFDKVSCAREKIGELGVLVCELDRHPPFAEADFIRKLARAAPRYGLDVYAFAPWTWNAKRQSIQAWKWKVPEGGWYREERRAPSLVYDRSWPSGPEEHRRFRDGMNRLQHAVPLRRLNGRLPGKVEVYAALSRVGKLADCLPPTALYDGKKKLADWLDRCGGAVFLKPSNGSQGRRVAAIVRSDPYDGTVTICGRTSGNVPFRLGGIGESVALERIHRWIGDRAYIVQPFLSLTGAGGEPFDVRLLAQRNGKGGWALAGAAIRTGRSGTVTSNLHGGGSPHHAETYLSARFGKPQSDALLLELRRIAGVVIRSLEQSFGKFAELGLDFGIDRSGRVWFLEANSKPGRAAMACAGGKAAKAAAERPLAYARYILLRPSGRVSHEFDLV